MTRKTGTTEDDPDTPSLTRGARARRALILRRAANRTSRRILRSLGTELTLPAPALAPLLPPPGFDLTGTDPALMPLGRPVAPGEALESERNQWGGRL